MANREQKIFQRVIQARRDRERCMRAREQGYRPTFVNPTVVPIQASWYRRFINWLKNIYARKS